MSIAAILMAISVMAVTIHVIRAVMAVSSSRKLAVKRRVPSAHLGGQVEFKTCTVGDTTPDGGTGGIAPLSSQTADP
mgnify:CR=1 FL=1